MLDVDSPPTVGQTWRDPIDLDTISVAFLIARDHEQFVEENYQLDQFRHLPEALCRMGSESRNLYAIRNRDFRDQSLLLKDGYLAFRDRERIKRITDNSLLACWFRRAQESRQWRRLVEAVDQTLSCSSSRHELGPAERNSSFFIEAIDGHA
jgi:hypothetical protein